MSSRRDHLRGGAPRDHEAPLWKLDSLSAYDGRRPLPAAGTGRDQTIGFSRRMRECSDTTIGELPLEAPGHYAPQRPTLAQPRGLWTSRRRVKASGLCTSCWFRESASASGSATAAPVATSTGSRRPWSLARTAASEVRIVHDDAAFRTGEP